MDRQQRGKLQENTSQNHPCYRQLQAVDEKKLPQIPGISDYEVRFWLGLGSNFVSVVFLIYIIYIYIVLTCFDLQWWKSLIVGLATSGSCTNTLNCLKSQHGAFTRRTFHRGAVKTNAAGQLLDILREYSRWEFKGEQIIYTGWKMAKQSKQKNNRSIASFII